MSGSYLAVIIPRVRDKPDIEIAGSVFAGLSVATGVSLEWLMFGRGEPMSVSRPVGSGCMSCVPAEVDVDRLHPELQVVLRDDMIPVKWRHTIPTLVTQYSAAGAASTQEDWIAEAGRLHRSVQERVKRVESRDAGDYFEAEAAARRPKTAKDVDVNDTAHTLVGEVKRPDIGATPGAASIDDERTSPDETGEMVRADRRSSSAPPTRKRAARKHR